tara:strand:- start:12025 stop:12747 length:723 start_codon:yes stop_codon:yes gene_type:complete
MTNKKKGFKIPERCLREDNPEPDINFDVKNELERIDEESNKESWSRKTGVYHPSSLHPNACKRAIWYDRIGEDPESRIPPDLRMLFDMGHALHDMLQTKLEKEFDSFKAEVPVASEELNMFGHCDGVFRDEEWVLEIKTVGESVYRNLTKPKIEHVYQVHCYMYALDIPRCQLLYVNRATGAMRNMKVHFQTSVWEKVCEIMKFVEDHVKEGSEPPRQISKWVCRSCKFLHACEPNFDEA